MFEVIDVVICEIKYCNEIDPTNKKFNRYVILHEGIPDHSRLKKH